MEPVIKVNSVLVVGASKVALGSAEGLLGRGEQHRFSIPSEEGGRLSSN